MYAIAISIAVSSLWYDNRTAFYNGRSSGPFQESPLLGINLEALCHSPKRREESGRAKEAGGVKGEEAGAI